MIRAIKALEDRLTFRFGNAATGVADADLDPPRSHAERHIHPPSRGREFDGIVDQIAQRIEHQAGIAGHGEGNIRPGLGEMQAQRDLSVFGGGLVELHSIFRDPRQIDLSEPCPPCPILQLCDPQHGREGTKNIAQFGNGLVYRQSMVFPCPALALGPFEPGQNAGQRRAQIVSDSIANAFHIMHQSLDIAEHAVHHISQTIEISGGALRGQTPRKISANDLLNGLRHRIEAAHRPHANDHRPGDAQQTSQQPTPHHGEQKGLVKFAGFVEILRQQCDLAPGIAMRHPAIMEPGLPTLRSKKKG